MKSLLFLGVFVALSLAVTQEDREKIEKVCQEVIEESERLKQQHKDDFAAKVSSTVEGKDPSCYAEVLKAVEEGAMKFIDFTFDGVTKRMKDAIEFARNGNDDYEFSVMIEEIDSGKLQSDAKEGLAVVNDIINNGYLYKLTQTVKKC